MKIHTGIICFLLFSLCQGCVFNEAPDMALYDRAQVFVDKGASFLETGDIDRAEASFNLAQELLPNAAAVDGLGCVAFMRGDLDRAEELFKEAYNMDSGYDSSLANLALLYDARGQMEKAALYYGEALRALPGDFRARNNFAALLSEDGYQKNGRELMLEAQVLQAHPLIGENLAKLRGLEGHQQEEQLHKAEAVN